ncbi:TonB system biopolymer transport component [Photobacterium aphoticum]|uniref:TonB system biopolymer transport component n=1 Tax=Photobacterium aphoticum TaxID=754436 RepID=A0A090QXI8_9GAMM|nr:TonB system biopolymer transport component [Photobacterium aphoticum]
MTLKDFGVSAITAAMLTLSASSLAAPSGTVVATQAKADKAAAASQAKVDKYADSTEAMLLSTKAFCASLTA